MAAAAPLQRALQRNVCKARPHLSGPHQSLHSPRLSPNSFQTKHTRSLTSSRPRTQAQPRRRSPPKTPVHQRAPPSEEKTQTDFAAMDVLRDFSVPATSIEMTMQEGFTLNNGQAVRDGSGLMMVGGDALKWRPWTTRSTSSAASPASSSSSSSAGPPRALVNAKGQWEVDRTAWGVLSLAWPRPDLLIVGTGRTTRPLSPRTRQDINDLGIRVEVQDTRNAAAQFNLLATERGVQQVAAAMIPLGWKDP